MSEEILPHASTQKPSTQTFQKLAQKRFDAASEAFCTPTWGPRMSHGRPQTVSGSFQEDASRPASRTEHVSMRMFIHLDDTVLARELACVRNTFSTRRFLGVSCDSAAQEAGWPRQGAIRSASAPSASENRTLSSDLAVTSGWYRFGAPVPPHDRAGWSWERSSPGALHLQSATTTLLSLTLWPRARARCGGARRSACAASSATRRRQRRSASRYAGKRSSPLPDALRPAAGAEARRCAGAHRAARPHRHPTTKCGVFSVLCDGDTAREGRVQPCV